MLIILLKVQTLVKGAPVTSVVTPLFKQLTVIPPPVLLHRALVLPEKHMLTTRRWAALAKPRIILLQLELIVKTVRLASPPVDLVPELMVNPLMATIPFRLKLTRVQFKDAAAAVLPAHSIVWALLILASMFYPPVL